MSRLLLMRPCEGGVDVLLADEERTEDGLRVFCRGDEVVLRLAPDEVIVVRDARRPGPRLLPPERLQAC